MQYVKAPDFPTGGVIFGMEGVKAAMHTGRGRVVLRGKLHVDTKTNGREQIIVTETPYQVNVDGVCDRIGQLVNEKMIDGITGVNNKSMKRRASGLRLTCGGMPLRMWSSTSYSNIRNFRLLMV